MRAMNAEINTQEYWEKRFSSGDWEEKNGRLQTADFALGQARLFEIDRNFEGTILDFGCGLGDAIPVYKDHFPKAKFIGVDISSSAIDLCRKTYGSIAGFLQGGCEVVTEVDIIVASNVFEHLSGDQEIAKKLLLKCRDLYVVVPYRENPLFVEHINSYDEKSFSELGACAWHVFPCRGWSEYGFELWYHVYFKNIFKIILRREMRRRKKQIMFHFKGYCK